MKAFRLAVLACVLCVVAQANIYDYTEQQIGTGSLDGVAFANALVTIVLTADTSGVTPGFAPGLYDNLGVATLTVAGISGVATFSGVSQVFVNQGGSVGIGNGPNTSAVPDVLDTVSPGSIFSTYGLLTPIGPVTGIATGNPTFEYQTSDGVFVLSSANPSETSTFTAGPASATPEPSYYLAVGAGIMMLTRFRKLRMIQQV